MVIESRKSDMFTFGKGSDSKGPAPKKQAIPFLTEREFEAEFGINTGTFNQDVKDSKAVTGRVAFSPEIPRQVGEAKAEWKILRELAATVCPERAHLLGCETGWQMREEIARVVTFYAGIEQLKATGDAVQYGGTHLCKDWKFPTPDGKAHFRAVPLPREAGRVVLNAPHGDGRAQRTRRAEDPDGSGLSALVPRWRDSLAPRN